MLSLPSTTTTTNANSTSLTCDTTIVLNSATEVVVADVVSALTSVLSQAGGSHFDASIVSATNTSTTVYYSVWHIVALLDLYFLDLLCFKIPLIPCY